MFYIKFGEINSTKKQTNVDNQMDLSAVAHVPCNFSVGELAKADGMRTYFLVKVA